MSVNGGPLMMYSSTKAVVPGCGPAGNGTRFTPGYWKNHQAATTAHLPQLLGSYTVSTFAQATAIFDAMKCSDAINCLAGHLLAAELDVASGLAVVLEKLAAPLRKTPSPSHRCQIDISPASLR